MLLIVIITIGDCLLRVHRTQYRCCILRVVLACTILQMHYSPSKLGNTMHLLCNRNQSCCGIVISAGAPLMQAHLKTEIFDLINIKEENSAE